MLRRPVGICVGLVVVLLGEVVARADVASVSDRAGARPLVAVVRVRDADPTCQEIATRIIAELMADGVPLMALTCPAIDMACQTISDARTAATVLVRRRAGVAGVQVRAGNAVRSDPGSSGPQAVATPVEWLAEMSSGGSPASLAVRTVELLRAMVLEDPDLSSPPPPGLWSNSELSPRSPMLPPPTPPPLPSSSGPATASEPLSTAPPSTQTPSTPSLQSPPASRSARRRRARAAADAQEIDPEDVPAATWISSLPTAPTGPRRIALTLGLAMIGSFAGIDAAFGPTLKLSHRTFQHVDLSMFLAGPAFAGDQQNIFGGVTVRQAMAALEADGLAMPWNGVVLRTGIGFGVYYIHVDGHVIDSVLIGRGDSAASIEASWSAGAVVNLRRDIGVFLDARLFLAAPTPVVMLNGLEVGRAGNPGIVLGTGVELRI